MSFAFLMNAKAVQSWTARKRKTQVYVCCECYCADLAKNLTHSVKYK